MMTIQEDKDFLAAQREKGRRGSMAREDTILTAKEKCAAERQEQMLNRRRRMDDMIQNSNATAELVSSDSEV